MRAPTNLGLQTHRFALAHPLSCGSGEPNGGLEITKYGRSCRCSQQLREVAVSRCLNATALPRYLRQPLDSKSASRLQLPSLVTIP